MTHDDDDCNEKVWESVGSLFRPGMTLEVVDKMRISQVRMMRMMRIHDDQ